MTRRALVASILTVLGICALLAPWTIAFESLKDHVARQIQEGYGLDAAIHGKAVVSLLPIPRVKLQSVTLSDRTGAFRVDAAQIKGELQLLPLLSGRIRLADLRIASARIKLVVEREGNLASAVDRLRTRLASELASGSRVDRLVVTSSQVRIEDRAHAPILDWEKVSLVARWPRPDADIDLSGSLRWRGEAITLSLAGLNPALLLSGQPDAVAIRAEASDARMSLAGDLVWSGGLRFAGLAAADIAAFGPFARWTGLGRDLEEFQQPVTLSGKASIDASGIEWPQVSMTLGKGQLEGSLAVRVDGARPMLRGTLAGDELDLGWILPLMDPARLGVTEADYDVRVSASGLRLGPLKFVDVAAGILIAGDRLELSLGRAGFAGGTLRGRVSATLEGEGRDIKGQVALQRVDLDKLLSQTGAVRGITGTVGGQANFEATGDRQQELGRSLKGRVSLVARDGDIAGVALAETARQVEVRPAAAAGKDLRGGRTRYDHAQIDVSLAGATAEITSATIDTVATQTRVQGTLSLSDHTLAVTTWTRPLVGKGAPASEPREPVVLEIKGPLRNLAVTARSQTAQDGPPAQP